MPTVSLASELELYVALEAPGTNYFSDKKLIVGDVSGSIDGSQLRRSWLRFPLGSIPSNATITAASLTFQSYYLSGTAGYADFIVDVARATDITWTNSITWNTAPDASVGAVIGSFDFATLEAGGITATLTYSGIASTVQSALPTGKLSIRLDASHPGGFANITNSGYPGIDSANISKLSVTYSVPSGGRPGIRSSGLLVNNGLLIGGGM